jgi:DNA polymerase-4
MRTERRKSGSARGDERLAAERRYGAHRLLNHSMRPSNSGIDPSCGGSLSSSPGWGTDPWSVQHPMKPGNSAYAPPCRLPAQSACARRRLSSLPISHVIALSLIVREIFRRHTDLIEPLLLDEAYLDVTANKTGLTTATRVATSIRQQIRDELNLTASAAVAPNKFLAKLASDWRKLDGLFVIQPEDVDTFLLPLPIGRLPGVGKVTEEKLEKLEIKSVRELRRLDLPTLEGHFSRYGQRLYELSGGIDNSEVVSNRPTKSISAEDTFEHDLPLSETEPMIRKLAEKIGSASRKESRVPRTVVLKLKTSDFNILTRSHTPSSPPTSFEELTSIALALRERVELRPEQRFRLVGVGLSNFCEPEEGSAQPDLFEGR